MRLSHRLTQKPKLNQTLRSWLPILQAKTDELKEIIEPLLADNPFADVISSNSSPNSHSSGNLEPISTQSLFEKLSSQITPPLFPSQKTQDIANLIISCINDEGYFEYDDEILGEFDEKEIERIRLRFAYLEPAGVGAKNLKESFLFQLDDLGVEDEIYDSVKFLIDNFENLEKYTKMPKFEKALKIIKKFKNPPAIEYLEDEMQICPDLFVYTSHKGIELQIADAFYPKISIDVLPEFEKNSFVSDKLKQAKDLIDALEMRKATLYKIGLMIIEYQYDYFFGGDIKPMRLKDIADDISRNPSTISRAIQNKYLSCSRGIIPLKRFFGTDLGDGDTSNTAIKDFVKNLVANENKNKPLSDEAILQKIKDEFNIQIVRRTITKYRKLLNIASSSQRKKLYSIKA